MRRRIPIAIVVVLLAVVGQPIVADAQTTASRSLSAAERELVGTWRLVTWEDRDRVDLPWVHLFGRHPVGLFIYTADGHISIQVMRGGDPDPAAKPRGELNGTFHAYFGTFTVDEAKHIVVHHVEASDTPRMVGTDQPREFQVKGDRLIIGDEKTRRRELVRVR